jgi:acetyl-CoA C-acetyltransferase
MTRDVYLLAAARTPMGGFQGALKDFTAPQLGAIAIAGAIEQSASDPAAVDEVIMGNVISAGVKQAPARQAMRQAGLPDACGATTLNKVCGSGMKAAMLATDLIRAGSAELVVAGGMESMTNAPYLLAKARSGMRMGHGELKDSMFLDGLEDAETGGAMGAFAQQTADDYQLSREAMDAFAIESLRRARQAIAARSLHSEIVPVKIGEDMMVDDEQPARAKPEKIPSLRPAFKKDGTITAANSSSISDGASALVLSAHPGSPEQPALARVVGHATHSRHPSEFTIAPVGAINKLCERIGWELTDVDLFEINEAFAMVTMLAIQELQLDPDQVNIYGGACAQGHPIGSTGSRLIATLAHALQRENKQRGIAALCIGGGEATAVALERVTA